MPTQQSSEKLKDQAQIDTARALILNKKFKNAIQLLEPLKDTEARFLLGIAYLDSGDSIERAK
jgi:hypothetical protein